MKCLGVPFIWLLFLGTIGVCGFSNEALACKRSLTKTVRIYKLLGPDLKFYYSRKPGKFGGYWRGSRKIYGRLDCPSARSFIRQGHYTAYRVFFATAEIAEQAGFRPCQKCIGDSLL